MNELLRVDRDAAFLEHFSSDIEGVDGRRKASVDSHLKDHLNDFGWLAPDIECSIDVHLELWSGCAHGGESSDRSELARPCIQAGA